MNKVIKIEDETVYVGKGDNGQFTAISRKSFGFEPQVGDYVEFYQNGDDYIVSKIFRRVWCLRFLYWKC